MSVITCIDDLKQIYKHRVPKMFYDYAETGSWTEQTFIERQVVGSSRHLLKTLPRATFPTKDRCQHGKSINSNNNDRQ